MKSPLVETDRRMDLGLRRLGWLSSPSLSPGEVRSYAGSGRGLTGNGNPEGTRLLDHGVDVVFTRKPFEARDLLVFSPALKLRLS
jgi:hypothetical protein